MRATPKISGALPKPPEELTKSSGINSERIHSIPVQFLELNREAQRFWEYFKTAKMDSDLEKT
jgi:hypothetical protein